MLDVSLAMRRPGGGRVVIANSDGVALLSAPIVATPGRLYSWEKDWANSAVIEVK
jgi:hypothetical protein